MRGSGSTGFFAGLLHLSKPRRPPEAAEHRSRRGLAPFVVEQDLAVAERQRRAGDDEAHAPVLAFELQDQAARFVFYDLLAHLAQRPIGLDWHGILASFPYPYLISGSEQCLCHVFVANP